MTNKQNRKRWAIDPLRKARYYVASATTASAHCENCIGADPDGSPEVYAIRLFAVGGLIFASGIYVFGKGYLRAGESHYAGFLICLGWIIQFVGVGLISLGVLGLT